MGVAAHAKPTSVRWWARTAGAVYYRNVVIMILKLSGVGGTEKKPDFFVSPAQCSHQPN